MHIDRLGFIVYITVPKAFYNRMINEKMKCYLHFLDTSTEIC